MFLLCLAAMSATAQYRIDQWTADNGLPQNSVYGITQTREGYLWIATVDGLARFDGARFTIFNKSNSPGIVNNRFISLFEDGAGDLWAGTEESGVVRFRGGRFESFGKDAGVGPCASWIASGANRSGVVFHGNGTILYRDGNFSKLDEGSVISAPTHPPASNIKLICRSKMGRKASECFVNGERISYSYGDGASQEKFVTVSQGTNVPSGQEANGTVWMITAEGRLARAEAGRVTRIYDERDGLQGSPLFMMVGARLGLVVKDADETHWLVDLPSMQKQLLFKKAEGPFPHGRIELFSTYADGEGNLWFGTMRGGLFRARKQTITAYSEADGIADKNIYPIYQDRAGTIWIGSTNGFFKYENGTFTLITSTKGFLVNAIGEDVLGRLLISAPVDLYVQENGQFIPFERSVTCTTASTNVAFAVPQHPMRLARQRGGSHRPQVQEHPVQSRPPLVPEHVYQRVVPPFDQVAVHFEGAD